MIKHIRTQLDEILNNIHNDPSKPYDVCIKQLKKLVRTVEITIVFLFIILITEIILLSLGYFTFSIIPIILITAIIYQIRKLWRLGDFIECHYEFFKFLFGSDDNKIETKNEKSA